MEFIGWMALVFLAFAAVLGVLTLVTAAGEKLSDRINLSDMLNKILGDEQY